MVDYDTAVAVVQNPDADPVALAKVAYENPDFGAAVAVNPRAYPGLKRWLAEFGDAQAKAQVASQGFPVSGETEASSPSSSSHDALNQESDQHPDSGQFIAMTAPFADSPVQVTTSSAASYYGDDDAMASSTTNPYGFTAQQALDPNTDAMTLARIAQYAPDLRPCLARNPSTYQELLQWLSQLHDPAIDAALATRR
ncbi:hypothetical protein [Bifidobacterium bombi]|uniref:Leucine rich repeat variant domain-containing protein n=1 Tax=Bifidobacterium bombi DSM 19703 TaxID=1341695 RepID=A0A080N2V0_9BIFI|nr:hypothetical protein [Bifidobacterium bombi]KFF31357.1 hypothetical protein BBOMB_0704 [Bifidobacterium bombi DSM 19703]